MKLQHMILLSVVAAAMVGCAPDDNSTKAERNAVKDGIAAFDQGNYAKAVKSFDEALKVAPGAELPSFDRAAAMYNLGDADTTTNRRAEAVKAYEHLGKTAVDNAVRDKSNYNAGNIAFHNEDYAQSIEFYKRVLRNSPDNTIARENLLVAELKLQQQQQDQQNQDQNQDQQEQQQQQQQQQQEQEQQQEQQPEPQPQQMSESADQILQTMQNRENQTREKANIEARPARTRSTDKPW